MKEQVRAKSVNTNEWCYGNLVETDNGCFIVDSATSDDRKTLIIQSAIPVDARTIGHYADTVYIDGADIDVSDLSERDSFKPIYGEDLIMTSYTQTNPKTGENEDIKIIGVLLWSDDFAQWEVVTDDGNIHRLCTLVEMYGVDAIIGNLHDNQELFKTYFPKGV